VVQAIPAAQVRLVQLEQVLLMVLLVQQELQVMFQHLVDY